MFLSLLSIQIIDSRVSKEHNISMISMTERLLPNNISKLYPYGIPKLKKGSCAVFVGLNQQSFSPNGEFGKTVEGWSRDHRDKYGNKIDVAEVDTEHGHIITLYMTDYKEQDITKRRKPVAFSLRNQQGIFSLTVVGETHKDTFRNLMIITREVHRHHKAINKAQTRMAA